MFRKIGGIILLVIGVGLGFLFFTTDEFDKQEAGYRDAVYLTDHKILPQNEGKIVAFTGTPVVKKPAADPQYAIKFASPFAYRRVQVYNEIPLPDSEKVKGSSRTTKMKWEMVPAAEGADLDRFSSAYLLGETQIGDFLVRGMFLRQLPRENYKGFPDGFAYKMKLKLQTDADGRLYLTQAQVSNDSDSYRARGSKRFCYETAAMDQAKEVTVIGIQKGKELLYQNDDFYGQLYVGKLSKEQLIKESKSDRNIGSVTAVVCCGLLIVGGGYLAFKPQK